MDTKFVVYQT